MQVHTAQRMGTFACSATILAPPSMKAWFRPAKMESGTQSVTTAGTVLKQMWSAGSLALAMPVSATYTHTY